MLSRAAAPARSTRPLLTLGKDVLLGMPNPFCANSAPLLALLLPAIAILLFGKELPLIAVLCRLEVAFIGLLLMVGSCGRSEGPVRTAVEGVSGRGRETVAALTGVCANALVDDVLIAAVVVCTRLTGLGIPPIGAGPFCAIVARTLGRSGTRLIGSLTMKGCDMAWSGRRRRSGSQRKH